MTTNKKFTAQARACIKGEAFFETLISDHALPHHIVGPKDLGIDYICEWVHQGEPTGILFGVQIKTFSGQNVRTQDLQETDPRNKLKRFKVKSNLLEIGGPTLAYWKGLGMPVYLFVMVYSSEENLSFDCYYKRFTYVLSAPNISDEQKRNEDVYYRANNGNRFIAFAEEPGKLDKARPSGSPVARRKYGFARDLFIDHLRCSYAKGSITWISPRKIGLGQFPEEPAVIRELFEDYKDALTETYGITKRYLDGLVLAVGSADNESTAS